MSWSTRKSIHTHACPAKPIYHDFMTPDAREKQLYEYEKEKKDPKYKAMNAERAFEVGIFHLMGLGITKNIQRGLESIRHAAELGSSRARNIYLCLLEVYNFEKTSKDELPVEWFIDESQKQVDPCFLDFWYKDRSIFRVIREQRKFKYCRKGRQTLSYNKDIAPYYSMEDTQLLIQQVNETRGRYNSGGTQHKGGEGKNRNVKKEFRDSIYFFRNDPVVYPDYDLGPRAFASLLHIAALFGFDSAVVAFLNYGFDIDAISRETIIATPLLCALYRGHSNIAELLIENGASCQPAFLWPTVERPGFAPPSPLHYLLYIDKSSDATNLADY
ncbi:uncharacterized protein EAE97_000409 [Botrytis byssoidea]|uniref:Uncharacterized protein n=1 Tax=Botrytis byssoidea TaxID=139641 RepID=A0A9P5IXI5_9HELO|nr:uncharacterized protein EAE97_000409 [Botrytis byssoidea]KAF7955150.1 hypothetical protein EAE97_000409 [Botrytis byssoidea]